MITAGICDRRNGVQGQFALSRSEMQRVYRLLKQAREEDIIPRALGVITAAVIR